MNTETLLREAMRKIADASAKFQTNEITRLNRLAERIAEIQAAHSKLEQELVALSSELNLPLSAQVTSTTGPRANDTKIGTFLLNSEGQTDIRYMIGPVAITIDWAAIGKPYPKQVICERKASDTLREFFEVILDRFGAETLGRLVAIRANRAPLLSRQPRTEFLNLKQGVCYQHQRVGTSDWYVLTHSSTSEKLAIIRQVARALRFPTGAIAVQEVDMKRELENLLN